MKKLALEASLNRFSKNLLLTLTLLLVVSPAVAGSSVDVCSSPCIYPTLAAALAGESGNGNVSINIKENIFENVTIASDNFIISSVPANSYGIYGTGSSPTISIGAGISGLSFSNITIDHTGNTGDTLSISGLTGLSSVLFTDTTISHSSISPGTLINASFVGSTLDQIKIERSHLQGTAGDIGFSSNILTFTSSIHILNSIFSDFSGTGKAFSLTSNTNNAVALLDFNTFYNNNLAIEINSTSTFRNNLLVGNTDDLLQSGFSTDGNFSYCGFQEQVDTTFFGTGCLFNLNPTTEMINPAGGNLHLASGSNSKDSGVVIAGITTDKDLVTRSTTPPPDIGAYEWVLLATPTPGPVYVGNQAVVSQKLSVVLDNSTYRYSMRFTQQGTKTISNLRLYVNSVLSSPSYRVGVQADNAGNPDGSFIISSVASLSAGWNQSTMGAVLNDGQVYHIVVEYAAGTIGASNWAAIGETDPYHQLIPIAQQLDPQFQTLFYNGSWSARNRQPVFAIVYSDASLFGNPYDEFFDGVVHNSNTSGDTTDDKLVSQMFTPQGQDWSVSKLAVWLYVFPGFSGGDLFYNIENVTDAVSVTSGTLVVNGACPVNTPGWIEVNLGGTFNLLQTKQYRLELRAPNTSSSSSYRIARSRNSVAGYPYEGLSYDGTVSFSQYSSNNGSTWIDTLERDMGFRFVHNPVLGDTPTNTPTASPSPSNSPSQTGSPTPSPTASPTPCTDLVVSGFTNLGPGTFNYCSVHVQTGGTLQIIGIVQLNLSGDFTIDSGGFVNGDGFGLGFSGMGQFSSFGGGGGGHAGTGGDGGGGGGGLGGSSYDNSTAPLLDGSMGGTGTFAPGGYGGAALVVNATGWAVLNGSITMNGLNGNSGTNNEGSGGGGSGGSVFISADQIHGTGSISATGGIGGGGACSNCYGGGGGSGGLINLCHTTLFNFTGSTGTWGGGGGFGDLSPGNMGATGTVYSCTNPSLPTATSPTFSVSPTISSSPTPSPTASSTPTPSPTMTASPTFTMSPTATGTWTPTYTPSVTPTDSPTSTWTPTATPTDSPTSTWSPTGTPTDSPTSTWTPTATGTWTPTWTETATPTITQTHTPTATTTVTPSITNTYTYSPTITETPTETPTATLTPDYGCTLYRDSVSEGFGATATFSFNHTTGNLIQGLLVVFLAGSSSVDNAFSVTYNSTPMVELGRNVNAVNDFEIYYLINPPAGTFAVNVQRSLSSEMHAVAITYGGVNQTSPIASSQFDTAIGTSLPINFNTVADNSRLVTLGLASTASSTLSASGAMILGGQTGNIRSLPVEKQALGAGNYPFSFSQTISSQMGAFTIEIKPGPCVEWTSTVTRTPSSTPSATPTFTVSPTRTATATASPTPSATPTASPSFSASPTFSVSPTASQTFTFSPTATPTATITPTHTVTTSFTYSPTATSTRTSTKSFTYSPTTSPTATITPTHTATASFTYSPTTSPTATITPTHTATTSFTYSPTTTPSFSHSPTITASPTATESFTASPSFTATPSTSPTRTITSSFTVSPTRTPSFTASATFTASPTPTPQACGVLFESASTFSGFAITLNFNHTVGVGTDRLLLVHIGIDNNVDAATSVTYNGLGLTKIRRDLLNNLSQEVWYLKNPPSGNYTVSVNRASTSRAHALASSWAGVDQALPLGVTSVFNKNGTTLTHNLTAQKNNSALVGFTMYASVGPFISGTGSGQTIDSSHSDGFKTYLDHKSNAVPGATTMSYTFSGSVSSGNQVIELNKALCAGETPSPSPTLTESFTVSPTITQTHTQTPAFTHTITPTYSPSPVPPPVKLNLEVWDSSQTTNEGSVGFRITNYEASNVALNRLRIKGWFNSPVAFAGNTDAMTLFGAGAVWQANVAGQPSPGFTAFGPSDCGSGRIADIEMTFTFSSAANVTANGGYISSNSKGLRWHRGDWANFVSITDDYSRPQDAGLTETNRVNLRWWTLYYDTTGSGNWVQVCEYLNATTVDTNTGEEPCGVNACYPPPATGTPTSTPSSTPSSTPTATPTLSASLTATPTASISPTPLGSFTNTPSVTISPTSTPSPTITQTPLPPCPVTLESSGSISSTTNLHTLPITVSGSNTLLVAHAFYFNTTLTISPMTYNGVPLTFLRRDCGSSTVCIETWYLANPNPGTHNLSAKLSGSTAFSLGGSVYSGVNQTNPLGVSNKGANAPSTNHNVSLTTTNPGAVLAGAVGWTNSSSIETLGGLQTQIWRQVPSGVTLTDYQAVPVPGATTMSYTLNPASWGMSSAVEIIPASCIATVTPSMSPTQSNTFTHSPTPTISETITETSTPTVTMSATGTWTPSVTKTITETITETSTPTFTLSPSATGTTSPTQTASPSPSATPTITETSTLTTTQTYTPTVTTSHTASLTPSGTVTGTATETSTPSVTATITKTITVTSSPTATGTWSHTYSPTATPTISESMSPTATGTWTPSVTKTITETITETSTPTFTLSPSATGTTSPTRTASPSPSATPSITETSTLTATQTYTPTVTASHTASLTPSGTVTGTATETSTPSVTATITKTITVTSSPTATGTWTPTASITPSISPSNTFTKTPTLSPSITVSFTYSVTPSPTQTNTPLPSATFSPTLTNTPLPTATLSSTPSNTPLPSASPSATYTATKTNTPYVSPTPTFTITQTFTITNTPLPTATAEVPAVLDKNIFKPMNGQKLTISFKTAVDGQVEVKVFNLAAELVQPVWRGTASKGLWMQSTWNGRNQRGEMAASGVYFVSIQGAGINSIRKVILLK